MSLSGRIVSDAADPKTESSRTPQRRQISASLAQSTTLGPMRIIANPVPIMPEISSGGEAESARATGGASCDGAADGAGFADSNHPQPDGETGGQTGRFRRLLFGSSPKSVGGPGLLGLRSPWESQPPEGAACSSPGRKPGERSQSHRAREAGGMNGLQPLPLSDSCRP